MLTGNVPMDAPLRAMRDRVPSQLANELGLPEFNCQVVLSAMALYPQQRIPNVLALVDQLRRCPP